MVVIKATSKLEHFKKHSSIYFVCKLDTPFCFFFFLVVLRITPRASHILSKHCAIVLYPQLQELAFFPLFKQTNKQKLHKLLRERRLMGFAVHPSIMSRSGLWKDTDTSLETTARI